MGEHTISCTATDAAGNSETGTFKVTVTEWQLDFTETTSLSGEISVSLGRAYYNRRTGNTTVTVTVTNTGTGDLTGPTWFAIEDISLSTLTFTDADGADENGTPYYLVDLDLAPGGTKQFTITYVGRARVTYSVVGYQ